MAKIFVSFTIVSTSDFFLVAREDSNPLAEVYRSPVLVPPHSQRNVTIDNLNPVMHRVELWTTLDGVNLNQLRGRCDIDASQYTQVAFDDLYFIVDRGLPLDPAANTNQYDNPFLAGKKYTVFMPGFGPLIEGIHIERNLDVNNVDLGGFHFINGQEFLAGAEYTIMIANLTTQKISSGNNSGFPNSIIQVIGDIDLSTPHYGNILEMISQGNSQMIVTIPDINAIPENVKFGINTHNVNPAHGYRYTVLQMPLGSYVLVDGLPRNTVYIGRGENVSFIKQGAYLRIINDWAGPRMVGRRIFGDGLEPINGIPMLGGWFPIAQYLRLFFWYVNALPPSELGTGFTDDQNPDTFTRLRWIIGINKFWVPDHSGYFYRNITGGRNANSFQDNSLQPAQVGTIAYTGNTVGRNSLVNNGIGFAATHGDGGSVAWDHASQVNRLGARTDTWPLLSGDETRPKNIGQAIYVLY